MQKDPVVIGLRGLHLHVVESTALNEMKRRCAATRAHVRRQLHAVLDQITGVF